MRVCCACAEKAFGGENVREDRLVGQKNVRAVVDGFLADGMLAFSVAVSQILWISIKRTDHAWVVCLSH